MRLFKLLKLESELRDELMENTRLLFKYMLSPKNNHKRYLVDTSSNSHIDFMHQYPSKGTQVEIIHMKNGNHKIRMTQVTTNGESKSQRTISSLTDLDSYLGVVLMN